MKKIKSHRVCRACNRKHYLQARLKGEGFSRVKARLDQEPSECPTCGLIEGQPQLFDSHPPTVGKISRRQDDEQWWLKSG